MKSAPIKELLLAGLILAGLLINKSYETKQQKLWKLNQEIQSQK